MKWKIAFSHSANKSIKKNHFDKNKIIQLSIDTIKKYGGETNINVDVKKLDGSWKDFYRIHTNDVRIIFKISIEEKTFYIEKIGFRGNIYN